VRDLERHDEERHGEREHRVAEALNTGDLAAMLGRGADTRGCYLVIG
jgi:hypothetical protein